jgi:hypothetical protein
MPVKVIVACTHLLVAEGITELIKGIQAVQVITCVNSGIATVYWRKV